MWPSKTIGLRPFAVQLHTESHGPKLAHQPLSFSQIILGALLQSLERQRFILISTQNYERQVRICRMNLRRSVKSLSIRKR